MPPRTLNRCAKERVAASLKTTVPTPLILSLDVEGGSQTRHYRHLPLPNQPSSPLTFLHDHANQIPSPLRQACPNPLRKPHTLLRYSDLFPIFQKSWFVFSFGIDITSETIPRSMSGQIERGCEAQPFGAAVYRSSGALMASPCSPSGASRVVGSASSSGLLSTASMHSWLPPT